MGNFEKLVVLTVLFLAATILGISMHGDGEERTNAPLGDAPDGTGALSSLVEQPGAPEQPGTSDGNLPTPEEDDEPVVDPTPEPATFVPGPETVKPIEAAAAPERDARSILVTTEGLIEPFQGAEYLYYTLQPGDSVFQLAERFYGERRYHELLRRANPEPADTGDAIMVPRFDLLAEAEGHVAKEAAPAHEAPIEVPTTTAKARTYEVAEGDSLWTISATAYGKGSRWNEIFQANRHQLDSEHDLQVGMELIIP